MTGPSSRVPLLLALVWLGGLLAATSVGLLAVRLVAAQVGDPAVAPLSAVAAASAAAAPSARPSPSAVPPSTAPSTAPTTGPSTGPLPSAPTTTTTTRTFTTAAGTLGVQCAGTRLRLLYTTPAQGYAHEEQAVSGAEAEVRFEGGGTRVRVRLSCATGTPQIVEQRTDPDGGDGGDDEDDDREEDDGPDDDE